MATTLSYESLRERHRWNVPSSFNIAVGCCDRHPGGDAALVTDRETYSFGRLRELSNRFANALAALGVSRGDRVAIFLPQSAETGIAHVAAYKLGAVAVPMTVLFGPQAVQYRLGDSGARVVVTDLERVGAVLDAGVDDVTIVVVDGGTSPLLSFWELVGAASPAFEPVATRADDPAVLIYTSGTTGAPKGALLAHRTLLGHLPGFELSHDFFPQADDAFWTPADWAWIGGLMDALLPAWYHGRPVVVSPPGRFDPERAARFVVERGIRNVFLPPTALKLMREADVAVPADTLRSVMSGGEPLGEEMLRWGRSALGVTVNEIYGQTEANYLVGNCSAVWPVKPGSMGRPYPGHDVQVVDEAGRAVAVGEVGEVALALPDPVAFLEYVGRPDATRDKRTADGMLLLTGDLARVDEDGYLWFEARRDDVITSAGYRIGPAEIEECILRHPLVVMAAAIGVPDTVRGHVVKVFVQLAAGATGSDGLADELRELVRTRLAPYETPRYVEFVGELPLTTTGKIRRAELREGAGERAAP